MRTIALNKGKVAIVDDEDVAMLVQNKWYVTTTDHRNFYACTTQTKEGGWHRIMSMHRLLLNPQKGFVVDHINGNGLDNRRTNLRVCSTRENMCNRKHQRGATGHFKGSRLSGKRWRVSVTVMGKMFNFGYFETELEAAIAYDRAAIELHGEFAGTNFLPTKFVLLKTLGVLDRVEQLI